MASLPTQRIPQFVSIGRHSLYLQNIYWCVHYRKIFTFIFFFLADSVFSFFYLALQKVRRRRSIDEIPALTVRSSTTSVQLRRMGYVRYYTARVAHQRRSLTWSADAIGFLFTNRKLNRIEWNWKCASPISFYISFHSFQFNKIRITKTLYYRQ